MELVDGKPLSQLIKEKGTIDPDQVRSIVGQCALALGVAHEAKVVHRDVKPANILVREDGLVKLTDFGIARAADASGHTRAGDLLGTPSYISPEQALGRAATGASDLYALGIVGHEMLSGAKPFDKPTPIATAMSHIYEPPPALSDDVPEDLAGVIDDLLAKDPRDRPENARAVAIRLGLADHEIIGLALGLAQAVYGESTLEEGMATIGFIGLGNMGLPMAGRLLDAGYQKITWKGHETYAAPGQWVASFRNLRSEGSARGD